MQRSCPSCPFAMGDGMPVAWGRMEARVTKGRPRLLVDIGMAALWLLQMAPSQTGGWYHELAGIALVALMVTHHMLNKRWLRAEWRQRAWVPLALDAALALCVAGIAATGAAMAQHVTVMRISGWAARARTLHACLTYLGLLLVSVHTGTHIPAVCKLIGRLREQEAAPRWPAALVCISAVALGAYEFDSLGVATKLSLGMSFPDGTTAPPLMLARHLLLVVPFVLAGGLIAPNRRASQPEKRS